MAKKKITIICCCYNEENNVLKAYNKFLWLIETCPQYDFEVLFEDNCSTDHTQAVIREIAKRDQRIKAIFNQGNFGIAASSVNAFSVATGDAVIPVACDLQYPVEVLPEFLDYWKQGFEVVFGQKTKSKESKIKYKLRSLYYNIIDFFSDYPQFHHVTGFGVLDRKVLDLFMISKVQDSNVMMRNFAAEYNFKTKIVPYEQQKRNSGKSSYNLYRALDFSITSLCNTSKKPLRAITISGIVLSVLTISAELICLIYKLINWNSAKIGLIALVIGVFFIAAVQLFCLGLLGEYITIILQKICHKPIVIEKERLNFDNNDPQAIIYGGSIDENRKVL